MITITIGRNNDEIIVRGRIGGCYNEESEIIELVNRFARDIASRKGWIVDSNTILYEYRERIAKI
jgi:hypothetical protein